MGRVRELFSKPAHYLILAFIIGMVFMLAYCEDANAETAMALAPITAISGDIQRGSSFQLGVKEYIKRYEFGAALGSVDGDNHGLVEAKRIIGDGPFNLGFGAAYWFDQSPGSDSYTTFSLSLSYDFNDNFGIEWAHWSTGGISDFNAGYDVIYARWKF